MLATGWLREGHSRYGEGRPGCGKKAKRLR
ncbi:hypothetical protein GGR62_002167 [Xanthomonas campestris]|nr:hypothetical protein [Xanthomonas sp. 3075]